MGKKVAFHFSSGNLLLTFELIIVLCLCYFPLCYRIDALSIRQWDEARNAVHAMEMLQNKNYIVRYYEQKPEVWETKPPLLIWCQVLSLKAFGYNELAIRFPVIIATFLTVLLMIWYFHKYYHKRIIGYLAALVLVTSQGYIDRHIARTGDHDALLILFLTAIILLLFRYIANDKPKPHLLICVAILFAFGVLTKSIAAFFIMPGLALSVLAFKSVRKLFYDKWFYVALVIFLFIVGSYYITREFMQPGYLKAVWHWELFSRYANTEHKFDSGTFWYYGVNFFKSRFNYWIYFLLASLITLPFLTRGETRKLYYFLLINMVAFFLVISMGSKGLWYDGPLFPMFSLAIALFLYYAWKLAADRWHYNKVIGLVVTLVIATMLYLSPALSIMKKVSRTNEYPWDSEYFSMAYWLRENNNVNSVSTPLKVVYRGYNAHLLFYVEAINYAQQEKRLLLENPAHINPGDLILISQKIVQDSIDTHYKHEVLILQDPVKLIQIGDRIKKGDK